MKHRARSFRPPITPRPHVRGIPMSYSSPLSVPVPLGQGNIEIKGEGLGRLARVLFEGHQSPVVHFCIYNKSLSLLLTHFVTLLFLLFLNVFLCLFVQYLMASLSENKSEKYMNGAKAPLDVDNRMM